MYCISCGRPNADNAAFCTSCGQKLFASQQAVPVFAAPPQKKQNTWLIVAIVGGVLLLLSPFFIGFAIGFGRGFSSSFENSDQKVARLMREAAGLQPVQKPLFGENKLDTQLRDLFRKLIQLNKDYQANVDRLNLSETRKLATSESFVDPSSASEGLKQLHAAYDLDAQQEQQLQQLMESFRHQFDDVSASERETIVEGFNKGLAQSMVPRQHATSTEKAWVDAMDDVYNYAELHHADFNMRYGQLVITDDAELQEFNDKIHSLNARRQEFQQAQAEFNRFQGSTWQKMGVSGHDVGAR